MDPLLRPFVDAADEADAERELNVLIERHALPLARTIVARKLRAYRPTGLSRSTADDRDDVIADAMVTLVGRLRAARFDTALAPIDSFEDYAATVIHSACAHEIRRRYPERARLKNRLRYVFSTERRLALWTFDGEIVCGLADWRGRAPEAAAAQALQREADRRRHDWMALAKADLSAASVDLAAATNAPVEFETFVRAIAAAAGVVEARDVSNPSRLASRDPAPDAALDDRRFLTHVWQEIAELPVRQRIALLLNLRDAAGAGLLWLLPVTGIASLREIARVLEMPDADLAELWPEIPLDDAAIAGRLACTRQQVINLRMAARKRLMHRTAPRTPAARPRGAQGNLTAVSASVKGRV